jgi:hypothetical protein
VQRKKSKAKARKKEQGSQYRGRSGQRVCGPARAEKSPKTRTAAAHAQGTPFGALQEHHPNESNRNYQLRYNQDILHRGTAAENEGDDIVGMGISCNSPPQ